MWWFLCIVLAVAYIMQQVQLQELRRKLNAITDAAASFLEVRPDER